MNFLGILFSSLILTICAVDDLRTKKIHNKLLLFLLPLALAGAFFLKGFSLLQILTAALLSLVITFPLYIGKVLGGGDLKFFFVFSLTITWMEVWQTFFYALPWALLLGMVKLFLDKKLKIFFLNLFFLIKFQSVEKTSLHTIPFSAALFFGWMTVIFLKSISL